MFVPVWVLVLFALWAMALAATYVLIAKWGGAQRRTSMKIFAFTIAGTLVAALGVVALYARSHAAARAPSSTSRSSDCDTPPAPAPAPAPTTPPTSTQASASPPASKPQPNFLTFAACSDGGKAPAKPAPR